MSISGISGSASLGVQQLLNTSRSSGVESGSDSTSRTSSVTQSEGDAFLKSLFSALNALGLQAPPPAPEESAPEPLNSSGASSDSAVPDALNAFIGTLFQALAGGSDSTSSTGDASYPDVESSLQSLIASLSSSGGASASSSAPGTSDLQDSFEALKSAIAKENSATGGGATEASSATLQSFLQNLLGNLQSQDSAVVSLDSSGSLVKTYA